MDELSGRVVWVTGSARRVGRVIALELARAGADVVVHCHESIDEGHAVVEEIRSLGRRSLLVRGDHSSRHDVWEMVREIDREFSVLDGLVNNASTFPRKAFPDVMESDFDASINANLRGPFLCAQIALPLLRKRSPSRIINILDAMMDRPRGNYSAYWCAKGGLKALTLALAAELAPGILVNGVAPGPVLPGPEMTEEQIGQRARQTLLGRWGSPEDVARAVRYLMAADNVTGTIMEVGL